MFVFSQKPKREIFEYFDGEKSRKIDPIYAWRKMWNDSECDPNKDFGPAHGYDADGNEIEHSPEALDRVMDMTRRIFGVSPWSEDSEGLTEKETLELLTDFVQYVTEIKKKRKT